MTEGTPQEKERLNVLLARYQIGLLSDGEKEELTVLQRKLYGDSTLYRESEFEKLACAPKKGDTYMPMVEEAEKESEGAEGAGEAKAGRKPRIVEAGREEKNEEPEGLFDEPKKKKKSEDEDLELEEL
jgi:hypothetical protein